MIRSGFDFMKHTTMMAKRISEKKRKKKKTYAAKKEAMLRATLNKMELTTMSSR